jgi:hypothetical protein
VEVRGHEMLMVEEEEVHHVACPAVEVVAVVDRYL